MLVAFHGRGRIIGHVTGLKVREMTGGLAVTYVTRRSNQSSSLDADWLLLHQGVVSNVQIARSPRLRDALERRSGLLRVGCR